MASKPVGVTKVLPVIMAGGSGSRLWPLSRQLYPKQFLPLLGEDSMLQNTVLRLKGLAHQPPLFICNEEHRFTVAEQLREQGAEHGGIILEPVGRNTAPAIALAALKAMEGGDDPVLLVLAADHAIQDVAGFHAAIEAALPFANAGKLVTFGIVPTGPETGYGYIRAGKEVLGSRVERLGSRVEGLGSRDEGLGSRDEGLGSGEKEGQLAFDVAEFVEKPDLATAESYVESGNYYWNSGMFLFRASSYLAELEKFAPEILKACRAAMSDVKADLDFVRVNKAAFEVCPDDSIDYAVMERTGNGVVVPMDCGWSDVGSWSALWEVSEKDADGNTLKGDVLSLGSTDCFVQSEHKFIATIGLHDVVVVESDDAIMVAAKDCVQDVKKVVDWLKKNKREEARAHRKVYRPWGYYDSIDQGNRFKVKRIVVNSGAKLSLQMHHHRAEHWIVVSGTATVTRGDETFLVSENESTYIPLGVKHRLENTGTIPLEMIEVQSGSYLGEDDIVRFDDVYGRQIKR